MKKKICFLLCILSCVFSGCVSISIKEKVIQRIDFSLYPINSKNASIKVKPKQLYTVRVTVEENGNKKLIKYPNYSELIFESEDFDVVQHDRWNLIVVAKYPNLNHLYEKNYYAAMYVKENSFGGSFGKWLIDWKAFYELDYSGEDGKDGADGLAGNSAVIVNRSYSLNGENGSGGSSGRNGEVKNLEVAFLYANGDEKFSDDTDRMLIFYDAQQNETTFKVVTGGTEVTAAMVETEELFFDIAVLVHWMEATVEMAVTGVTAEMGEF